MKKIPSTFLIRTAAMLLALACGSLAFCGEIHDAAMRGDLEKVKALLKADPNLVFSKDDTRARDSLDGYDATPLHAAALGGHKDVAELLLANKADANARDEAGRTPLHDAAMNGHKDVVELLLASKAGIDAKDRNGDTPLDMAAGGGHKDVAELLLANGAKWNIHDAIFLGDMEKIKTLLNGNPDLVSSKNSGGMTPLILVACIGRKDIAELLLADKADVNATDNNGMTPLLWAATNGHKDVVELLLAGKADINAEANGETVLDCAAIGGHRDVAELLLANRAKCNIHDAVFLGDLERVKALLKGNPDLVASKNSIGMTPLFWAVCISRKDIAELLVANKADVNATDNNGMTPLHRAELWNNKEMVEWLRQHGGHE